MDLGAERCAAMSVLLVDDHVVSRYLIRKILDEIGFGSILETDNGSSALEHYLERAESGKPFDLVITDWMMPGLSGIELVRNIKLHLASSKTLIMMTTASNSLDFYSAAANEGIHQIAFKPVRSEDFKARLATLLRRGG